MSSQTYTILWRGQTSGPYSVEQIEQMLANRQVSLSHQVNDEGKLIFVEDFLAGKKAEGAHLKAEQEAKVAETKAQAEHQRQKELVELDIVRAQAAAPPPPVPGAPPVLGESPIPAPVPMPPVQSSSSGVLEVIFALVVISALGVGGWFAYEHYSSGPTVEEVEKPKEITGYETKTVFIKDSDTSKDINDYSRQGWEIKSQRRAWSALFEGADKEWGTEYSIQKAIYE